MSLTIHAQPCTIIMSALKTVLNVCAYKKGVDPNMKINISQFFLNNTHLLSKKPACPSFPSTAFLQCNPSKFWVVYGCLLPGLWAPPSARLCLKFRQWTHACDFKPGRTRFRKPYTSHHPLLELAIINSSSTTMNSLLIRNIFCHWQKRHNARIQLCTKWS